MGILKLPEQPNSTYATKEELKKKADKSYVDTKLGEKAENTHTHDDLTRLINELTERVVALEGARP